MFKRNNPHDINDDSIYNTNQKKFLAVKRILKMVNVVIVLVFSIIAIKYIFGV